MPYKRKTNKRVKSTKTKKFVAKKAVIPRTMVSLGKGFPKKLQFTHKYTEGVTVTSTTGIMANYLWSCNGMYDPNSTTGGHQPMYYDQLKILYDHYVVIGSKIKITVMPNYAVTAPIAFGIVINDDTSTTPGYWENMDEQTQGRVNYLTYNNASPKLITAKWSAKKFFGGAILSNPELQGDSTNNPAEQSYFNFYLQAVDKTSTASAYVSAEIEYIAVWKELKDFDPS